MRFDFVVEQFDADRHQGRDSAGIDIDHIATHTERRRAAKSACHCGCIASAISRSDDVALTEFVAAMRSVQNHLVIGFGWLADTVDGTTPSPRSSRRLPLHQRSWWRTAASAQYGH
jgi:hypothetical protein